MNAGAIRAGLVTSGLAAAVALVLHRLGTETLAAPPVRDIDAFVQWAEHRGSVGASMAVLRLAGFVVALHLAVVSGASALVALHPTAPLVAMLRYVTPAALRRTLGLGTIAALSVTAGMPGVAHADDAPVMVLVESVPPTLVHVASSPPGPAPAPAPSTPAPSAAPGPASPPSATSSWRVERGQHLWGIAEATVHARGGGAAQVPGYWRTLVEANRDRLVVPDRPDLIFPGQDLVLPPGP
jgi:hypothetical protein